MRTGNSGENESSEFPPDRVAHYEMLTEQVLRQVTPRFDEFVRGHGSLVRTGDERLRNAQGTGYNILLREPDMPLASDEPLIFYSNYIRRTHHLALVLAGLEARGLIAEEHVRLGVKASKTFYGGWDFDPGDEQLGRISRRSAHSVAPSRVSKTVETVLILSPRDDANARDIALYLRARCTVGAPEAIPGSWDVPDIRATESLSGALQGTGAFELVIANVFQEAGGTGELIIARRRTVFGDQGWRAEPVQMNEKLAAYLASSLLGVAP